MELKPARLTVLIDPAKKKAFESLCARQDVTPSQVVRRLIRDYLASHGEGFIPSVAPRPRKEEGLRRPGRASGRAPVSGRAATDPRLPRQPRRGIHPQRRRAASRRRRQRNPGLTAQRLRSAKPSKARPLNAAPA